MQNIKPFYKRPPEEEYFCNGQGKTDEFVQDLTKNSHNMNGIRKLYLSRNKITYLGALHFSFFGWDQLTLLSLISNQIGNKGSKYLSRVSFKKLQLLALDDNQIELSGLLHLSKTDWNMEEGIMLCSNKIRMGSCGLINRARWRGNKIELEKNDLNAQEIRQLILSQRGEEVYVYLRGNMTYIDDPKTISNLRALVRLKSKKFVYDF